MDVLAVLTWIDHRREFGGTYPQDSWANIIEECKVIEELEDLDDVECDTVKMQKYCGAAALVGQMMRIPSSDELPEDAPPLPPLPPRTGEEAFELALSAAEQRVKLYWPEITKWPRNSWKSDILQGRK